MNLGCKRFIAGSLDLLIKDQGYISLPLALGVKFYGARYQGGERWTD